MLVSPLCFAHSPFLALLDDGVFRHLRVATKDAVLGICDLFEKRSIKNFLPAVAVRLDNTKGVRPWIYC